MAGKDARSSPPIAMRIVRPYGSEAELLDHEASAFTRTGVVLIGAPSRPNGVVLRFEIALKDGSSLMRGEGRVVGYRPPMSNEEGALMLRFTRLDVKSKTLLDRAVAIREERRSLAPPPPARSAHAPASSPKTAVAPPAHAHVEPSPHPTEVSAHVASASASPPPISHSARPPLPSAAPVARRSTPAIPIPDDDPDEAEEVDDADIEAEEATVLDPAAIAVAHVAPVEHAPAAESHSSTDQALDDLLAAPIVPSVPPPPAAEPVPPTPPPPIAQQAVMASAEKIPAPPRAPADPARRLDPATRASALDRLRERAKKLADMPSYFPVGDRSSAATAAEAKLEPGHTPVLGSFVADRNK
jgi:hypothetical protein